MLDDVRSIGICIVSIIIGWQINLNARQYRTILLWFSAMILFVGLSQIFINIGGFVIKDQYLADNKNSLGVMMSTGAIILLYMALSHSERKKRVMYYLFYAVMFVCLLTIRARAACLVLFAISLLVIYKNINKKIFPVIIIVGFVGLLLALFFLPDSVLQYVWNSFTQNQETFGITSGRSERNSAAFHFMYKHFWLGHLNAESDIGWIHNYLLNRFFEFGVIWVIPIASIFMYIIIKDISFIVKSRSTCLFNVGFFCLLMPFVISLGEPTFPFGPGTATVFNFLLFGVSLKSNYNKSYYSNILN